MSYVRYGRNQQHAKTKRQTRPKKSAATKKEWVSTVNDLSVHKLTPAELNHRHEIHQSHNKAAAQWELKERTLKRHLRHGKSPAPLDQTSLDIIREVLSDEMLLQDVLARSDRAMAVVKDLFGESPRRQIGHPSVTVAPNCNADSGLPNRYRPDVQIKTACRSESVMDRQAPNEVEVTDEAPSDEETYFDGVKKRTMIDSRKMKHRPFNRQMSDRERNKVLKTPHVARKKMALNSTPAVKRVQSRVSESDDGREESSVLVSRVLNSGQSSCQSGYQSSSGNRTNLHGANNPVLEVTSDASLSGDHSTLGLLQTMLGQVEAELDTCAPSTEVASEPKPKPYQSQSLTGFSVALVSTLGRLVQHFNKIKLQCEEKSHSEAVARNQLEAELKEQRGLIDALTAETMTLREEAASLQEELRQRTAEVERKLDTMVLAMGDQLKAPSCPKKYQQVEPEVCHCPPSAEQGRSIPASPSVMPSKPQQVNDWLQAGDSPPVRLNSYSHGHVKAVGPVTSPSLPSLPSSSSPSSSSAPHRSQITLDAIMEEITQLSQQNDLLKAQLSRARADKAKVEGSTDISGQRRHLSDSSSERNTPLFVRESMTERIPNALPESAEQPTDQGQAKHFSVNFVQQRLLELNRQSAIARGRLLELIEQQRRSVSEVSFTGSSTPSCISTSKPRGEGAPTVFRQESQSQNSRPASETRASKTQVDQQREPDGWFALSAHVR
ncbi:spindle and centriole-associated protein 1 isoform X2 [Synchiropus splendidus]|uniref:spindle and centriole-associated protein 1 isoform X2 n=1 Tax=Synchiropus splendidus TaxID=270530 RepID=UPI00237DDEC1|nr:spindle and centriole-associated protein 1 isoform X2 [Synchiropus splendidus]